MCVYSDRRVIDLEVAQSDRRAGERAADEDAASRRIPCREQEARQERRTAGRGPGKKAGAAPRGAQRRT